MENKIESDKFDALQELSQIEMRLSDARVAFENFKKTEEEYMKQREVDVSQKLDKFIASLSESYQTFASNKKIFESIKGTLASFAEKAVNLTAEVKDISNMLEEKIKNVDTLIDSKLEKIKSDSDSLIRERAEFNAELESFSQRVRELSEAELKLNRRKIEFGQKWGEMEDVQK